MLSRFYGLYERNSDIGGWIKIDGTNVNYPVMKDTWNQFYRDHNYDRRYSPYGVPFFDGTAALVNAQSVNPDADHLRQQPAGRADVFRRGALSGTGFPD